MPINLLVHVLHLHHTAKGALPECLQDFICNREGEEEGEKTKRVSVKPPQEEMCKGFLRQLFRRPVGYC